MNNLPDVPLVDDGHQYKTHRVVLDAIKYTSHPQLLIYNPDLDPTKIIII